LTTKNLSLKENRYFIKPTYPFLYQKRGILMMLFRKRMILGDDVGLGKTLESIIHFTFLKSANPITRAVIFTEKIGLDQWQQEFEDHTIGISTEIITTETHRDSKWRSKALEFCKADVIISTYPLIYKHRYPLIRGLGDRYVVYADEPSYVSNPETKIHQGMVEIVSGSIRSYGLSAAVVENRPEELVGVSSALMPGHAMTMSQFKKDHCIRKQIELKGKNGKPNGRKIFITVGYRHLDIFRKRMEPFYFGRDQNDPEVEQDLPEVISKDVEITLSKEQSELVVKTIDEILGTSANLNHSAKLVSLVKAQQLVNDPRLLGFNINSGKTEALIEALQNSLRGQRVIIFSKLRTMIDNLEKDFKAVGIKIVRITGDEKDSERTVARKRFMSDGKDRCNVLLITKAGVKAGNYQKAGHFFFYDVPWSYGQYKHGIGRCKRTGATHSKVGVYNLLACLHPDIAQKVGSKQTIDHHTIKIVRKKKGFSQILTDDRTTMDTSPSDINQIFSEIIKSTQNQS